MATKTEKQAIKRLLYELETAQAWFDDTAYPRQSRQSFETALEAVRVAFGIKPPNKHLQPTPQARLLPE